jgi:dolichol-phosphate mannosyltransferase
MIKHLIDLILFLLFYIVGISFDSAQAYSILISFVLAEIYFKNQVNTNFENKYEYFSIKLVLCLCLLAIRSPILNVFYQLFNNHAFLGFIPVLLVTAAIDKLSETWVTKKNFLISLGIIFLFIRFLHLGTIELIPEEAYYWNYGVNLDFGYIDHPPFVGLLTEIGTYFFGTNEFGVRSIAFIFSLLTIISICFYHFTFIGKQSLSTTFTILLFAPYIIGSGLIVSPDTGLVLFWSLSLVFLYQALINNKNNYWFLVGITVGLGFLSKYTVVLIAIPTLVFCLLDKESRKFFKVPHFYYSALIALLFFTPVLYWNYIHDWISFTFQSSRRVTEMKSEFGLFGLFSDMAILFLPAILISVLFVIFEKFKEKDFSSKTLFALVYFLAPLCLFFFYSFNHDTKLNWTGCFFISILPLAAIYLENTQKKWLKNLYFYFPIFFVGIISIAFHYLSYGFDGIPYGQKLHRILGTKSLATEIVQIANKQSVIDSKNPVIAGMDKHFISSSVSFYAQSLNITNAKWGGFDFASRNIIGENALMWDFWSNPKDLIGRNFILVSKIESDISDERISNYFSELQPITKLELSTHGKSTKSYFYRIAKSYSGIPNTQQ